jgi:AcrR family transcriptional regulator
LQFTFTGALFVLLFRAQARHLFQLYLRARARHLFQLYLRARARHLFYVTEANSLESKKMDRRVRKTRMQLRAGLTQLMREKPIKDITVRELAQLVDINRCTFYLHYRDIYDMVEQVEQEVFAEFEEIVNAHPSQELQEKPLPLLADLFEFFSANADLCAAFLGGNGDMAFFNKLISLIRDRVVESWLQDQNKDPEHFDYYFAFLASGYIGIIREWFARDMRETPAEMATMTEQLVLYGLGH